MTPTFFSSPSEFRAWLEKNHLNEKELLVGFYKVSSGRLNMTWSQSVDEALCFGWIDGVRRSIDADSYCIRFTQRKKTSIWSAINIRKVEELTIQGRMRPAGLEAFSHLEAERSSVYSFEKTPQGLPGDLTTKFQSNPKAWAFFAAQPPSYRKMVSHWITSAKLEATRHSRLEKAINESEKQERLFDQYRRKPGKT